jgi:hypothetical protein
MAKPGYKLPYKTKICSMCNVEKTLRRWRYTVCEACHMRKVTPEKYAQQKIRYLTYARTPKRRFSWLKGAAKTRGLAMTLTEEDFRTLISLPCTYCGGKLPETGSGLDRIDNTRGYIYRADGSPNCVPCCSDCNAARRDSFTLFEFKQIVALLRKSRSTHRIWENQD